MLTFTERLSRDIAKTARMTLPELEAALAEEEGRTVSQLTALALAKKAAEGGMDAIKMLRELSKFEAAREQPLKQEAQPPMVEIRVVGSDG